MKILVDLNLSPDWCDVLVREGWTAVHWSSVGDPRATDAELMAWAVAQGYVVLTHDLDFEAILAITRAAGPSVIQIRTQDVLSAKLAPLLIPVLKRHEADLLAGALIVVDHAHARIRILPLAPRPSP